MPNNDSHQHVVKTTAQWEERAVEYWVVPRGCLCVELTPEGKTKLKVGEGNKYFKQLPYICDHGDLTNYYTKEEVDNLFDNLNRMAIMSTDVYDSADDLPSNDNKLGDVRFVKSSTTTDPDLYVWIGDRWIDVNSSDIDPSDFVTKPEFNTVKDKVDEIYPKAHTHANKDILDGITQADRDKFDDLHNYDDTELRRMIQETGHTHPNKSLLDTITQSSLWSASDRTKFDDLHNYDDTEVRINIIQLQHDSHTHANKTVLDGITQEKLDAIDELAATYVIVTRDIADLKTKSHTHANKDLLDGTTASFTVEQQNELYRLSQISTFIGAGPTWNGVMGYVPAPEVGQQTYYLRADGTWAKVKTGGDKYKAGEGIYILSGEVATDTFPFKVYSKSARLKQYVIYGAQGGVGTLISSNPNVYSVPLTISSPDYGTRQTNILISDPLYAGDYIDYQRQVFVHTRTVLPITDFPVDPNLAYRQGVYADGTIGFYYPGGGYADNPVVSLAYALESGASYEFPPGSSNFPDWQWNALGGALNVNLYDANMNRTRTVGLSFNNATIVTPTASEKYMIFGGIKGNNMCMAFPRITKLKDVAEPCVLQEVILYANTINTIDVDTSVKPSEMYVEVDDPPEDQPDDPLSNYTGIIYNDGVLDITQEDPNALNELTVHFRDDVDKTITIPSNPLEPATTTTLGGVIIGQGVTVDQDGEISVDVYTEGDAIEFQQSYMPITTSMKYIRWTITAKRGNDQVIQASEFEVYDESDYKITLSNAVGLMTGGTPSYQHEGVTPMQLIDGNTGTKMRCINFTTNLTITFTIQTPIASNLIKKYRYFTADETNADPITWTIQLSPDGETWYNVDQRIGEDITTSRNTATDFYTITKPSVPGGKSINVKYGNGLSLDGNGALTVTGGSGGGNYDAGQGITFTHPGMTDLGFDFDAFVAKITSMHNGTKTVDSEHEVLTLTATGDDCYTEPYSNTSAQYVYTFPIVAGHVYRLTWDSSNPSVPGRVFAFENVSETNLHWINQSVQDYLEFTAVTSGTINFRFGVQNSGNTISYSNIHFYEIDDLDPNTTIINADIAKGLEFDSLDKLQVKLGDGLHFDSNDAIELDSNLYYPGQGIEFGGETLIPTEFNQSAFINVIGVSRGNISKTPALDAFTLTATGDDCFTDHYDGWSGYYITAEPNTKYRVSWESANGTSGNMFVFEVSGTSYTGVMYIVNNANTNVNIFTTSSTCTKLSLRFGVASTGNSERYSNITFDKVVPLNNVIKAKLGDGLQFDANGAIEAIGGGGTQYVRVNTTDSYVLLHTKPADWDDHWDKYFELTYDEITTSPPDWDPTQHYKYENDNYVLGTAGDTFVSTTWYDKHYVGLDPTTAVTFDSDVYYTGELHLIEDGETYDTAFEKVNEAIEHIERLEQEVQYLQDDRVGVRVTNPSSENLEFYNK